MVTFPPLHLLPDEVAQTRVSVNTSSASHNHMVTVEHRVAATGYTPSEDENGSLENPSTKRKAPEEKVKSKDEIHKKCNVDNLEDCLTLSTVFAVAKVSRSGLRAIHCWNSTHSCNFTRHACRLEPA